MRLIIDIPEEYQRLCPEYYQGDIVLSQILHAVKHGTPIPYNATVCDKYAEQEPTDEWQNGYDMAWEEAEVFYEQEPCNDVVSRETVIEWLKAKDIIKMSSQEEMARKELKALPSVRPQEPRESEG